MGEPPTSGYLHPVSVVVAVVVAVVVEGEGDALEQIGVASGLLLCRLWWLGQAE